MCAICIEKEVDITLDLKEKNRWDQVCVCMCVHAFLIADWLSMLIHMYAHAHTINNSKFWKFTLSIHHTHNFSHSNRRMVEQSFINSKPFAIRIIYGLFVEFSILFPFRFSIQMTIQRISAFLFIQKQIRKVCKQENVFLTKRKSQ